MVVAVQDVRADAGGAEHPLDGVPFAVDGGIDHPAVAGQVGQLDLLLRGRRMVDGQGHALRFALHQDAQPELRGDAQRAALHLVHEGDVELAVGDHAEQGVGRDVHVEAGVLAVGAQPAQPARQGLARRRADAELGAAGRGRPRLGDQQVQFGHEGTGPAQDQAAERGGAAAGVGAQEERSAQLLLDAAQLCAQRRLGNAQLPGGAVQTAGVGYGAQRAEVPHLELHAL